MKRKYILLISLSVAFAFGLYLQFEQNAIEHWKINQHVLTLEVARTSRAQQVGLSQRERLEGIDGMLFLFSGEEKRRFWMKGTKIPLHVFFFNHQGDLVDHMPMAVESGKSDKELTSYQSMSEAAYALELPEDSLFTKVFLEEGELKLRYQ